MSEKREYCFRYLIDLLHEEEAKQKKRYDAAIDIEDMTEATAAIIDARRRIQQIRKWSEELAEFHEKFQSYFHKVDFPDVTLDDSNDIEKSDYKSDEPEEATGTFSSYIGDYVWEKLHSLSRSGYIFSTEQLANILDRNWSQQEFHIPHPFARLYDKTLVFLDDKMTDKSPKRYWVYDKFIFGDVELQFYCGWKNEHKERFDMWLLSLFEANKGDISVSKSTKDEVQIEQQSDLHFGNKNDQDNTGNNEQIDGDFRLHQSAEPNQMILFGKRAEVRGWKEVFQKLCDAMILRKPYIAASLDQKFQAGDDFGPFLSHIESNNFKEPAKLSNGLFVELAGTAEEVKRRCSRLLALFGYNLAELTVITEEEL